MLILARIHYQQNNISTPQVLADIRHAIF